MGRVMRRWALRLAVVAALAVLMVVDARMKSASIPGFRPNEVLWVAYAPDFSRFWIGVKRNDAFRAFVREWPRPYRDLQLAIRKATGIRPMPIRWGMWMGSGLLGFGTADGTGYCVRPGLLLRIAHLINAPVSRSSNDTYRYGGVTYAWRDGFLLFSTSPKVVAEALRGPAHGVDARPDANELRFEWRGTPPVELIVRAEESLPVRGRVRLSSPPPASSVGLVESWPGKPILVMAASDCAHASQAADWLRSAMGTAPDWAGLHDLIPPWVGRFPEGLRTERCAFALIGPGSVSDVPAFAEVVRAAEPLPAPDADAPPPFTAVNGPHWFAAGTPELLGVLKATFKPSSQDSADVILRVDWEQWGLFLERRLRERLEADESLEEAIQGTGLPAARAIGKLGFLALSGRAEGNALSFEGRLFNALPARQAASQTQ